MLKRSWFDLARHDEKDDADAAAAAATAKAEADGAAAAKADADKAAAAAKAEAEKAKPMTQAEIDAIVNDRLARERKKFADYDELKAKAAKHDENEAANATEQEKALAAAKAEAKTEVTLSFGQKLASAEIKAALTGVVPDPAAIAEDLNLAKYVKPDGEVDTEAVAALKAKYAALAPTTGKPGPKPDPAQGAGGGDDKADFRRADKADVDAELRKLGIRPR